MPTVAIASEFLDAFARIPQGAAAEGAGVHGEVPYQPEGAGDQLREDPRRQGRQGPHGADRPEVPGRGPAPGRGRRVRPGLGGQPRRGDGLGRQTDASRSTRSPARSRSSASARPRKPSPRKKKTTEPGLLDAFADDVLLSFGVPEALLPAVRAVKTQDALLALVKHLPAEAAEALTWLGEGIPVEEVQGGGHGHAGQGGGEHRRTWARLWRTPTRSGGS